MTSLAIAVSLSLYAVAAPPEMRAIVLTGAKLPARVASQLEPTKAKLKKFALAPGFPKIVESKSVEGLKPGFEVIVLGYCRDQLASESGLADLIVAEAKRAVGGAYGKRVSGDLPESCPRLILDEPSEDEGVKLWAALNKTPDKSEAELALAQHLLAYGELDGGEYLALRVIIREPANKEAKALLEKVGLLRAD